MSGGRAYDAHLHLLDRQIIDPDGRMVGKVDDVELAPDGEGGLYLAALLVGPAALGRRVGGRFGRLLVRLQGRGEPVRIPLEEVTEIGSAVRLGTRRPPPGSEHWIRDHVVARIPGASVESDE
ncbi:PRC-barrel domain-containing protein [Phytohabitans aurantiacus]|jgi:sporulation protein YlmC with PRC-barrel domain|uniref:PRC-barrel domain-containing protein n=1 Tax=Phytohabitans aurantiacus TaxID=3016789 RepID=A0ABQ5QVM2_9ACTN|nr:hypothetical protein [Phytohabitans aurantiacus]GLH97769.1 hypothetical protein Pa4123_30440 [Phytohabitans aurantiacus]